MTNNNPLPQPRVPPDDLFRQAARVVIEINRKALEELADK